MQPPFLAQRPLSLLPPSGPFNELTPQQNIGSVVVPGTESMLGAASVSSGFPFRQTLSYSPTSDVSAAPFHSTIVTNGSSYTGTYPVLDKYDDGFHALQSSSQTFRADGSRKKRHLLEIQISDLEIPSSVVKQGNYPETNRMSKVHYGIVARLSK